MNLSIGYITAREKPHVQWFLKSLARQLKPGQAMPEIWVVDALKNARTLMLGSGVNHVEVKPNYWSGKHRLTKENWWSKGAAINTFLCLARNNWVCMIDDRCVVMPGFFEAIGKAMTGNYILCGSYEKRIGMTVKDGVIDHGGIITAKDGRHEWIIANQRTTPMACGGEWMFGCINAAPLEAWLSINGSPEYLCDGLGMEDVSAGLILSNAGWKLKYDPTFKMVSDRTPGESKPVMHKTDMGTSPNDKSHKVLANLNGARTSGNDFSIRKMRESVLRTGEFPLPSRSKNDWYGDKRPIANFVAP